MKNSLYCEDSPVFTSYDLNNRDLYVGQICEYKDIYIYIKEQTCIVPYVGELVTDIFLNDSMILSQRYSVRKQDTIMNLLKGQIITFDYLEPLVLKDSMYVLINSDRIVFTYQFTIVTNIFCDQSSSIPSNTLYKPL